MGKFQAISRPGKMIFKSPGFPGSAGNPVLSRHDEFIKWRDQTKMAFIKAVKRIQLDLLVNPSLDCAKTMRIHHSSPL